MDNDQIKNRLNIRTTFIRNYGYIGGIFCLSFFNSFFTIKIKKNDNSNSLQLGLKDID